MRQNRFRTTREAHSRETAEDYVELVGSLIEEKGEARTVDLAAAMGVSQVTVTKTLRRLQRDGLIHMQPYRSIFLTEEGQALAAECKSRHELVTRFLLALGVSQQTAETDAEGIEHHVSQETLTSMDAFLASRGR